MKYITKIAVDHPIATRGAVAVVDDDIHISGALAWWLDLHGFHVTQHYSAESLLKAIHLEDGHLLTDVTKTNPIAYPLVGAVLDLNLPGITGFDLARTLRDMAPRLPLAIITALRDIERARYGTPPKDVRCLEKPFDLDALEYALFPLLN